MRLNLWLMLVALMLAITLLLPALTPWLEPKPQLLTFERIYLQ